MYTDRQKQSTRALSRYYRDNGSIDRKPCADCGSTKSEIHHPDYSDAEHVVWLCHPCHMRRHTVNEQGPSKTEYTAVYKRTSRDKKTFYQFDIRLDGVRHSGKFESSARLAAVALDKKLIAMGRSPINIFKPASANGNG